MEGLVIKVPFFSNPYTEQDIKAVKDCLESKWITSLGPVTWKFECAFSKYIGISNSIAVSSCTTGLELALKVLNYDDKAGNILLPSFTFHSDVEVILKNGLEPRLVDIEEDTYNIDPKDMNSKIDTFTVGALITHYGGQLCNMKEIIEVCSDNGLFLIEDCAHIVGGGAGTFGEFGVFSFYSTKPISCGQGGMIVTPSNHSADKLMELRHHYMSSALDRQYSWQYDVEGIGNNYCMTEMQCALGLSQLSQVEYNNNTRIKKAGYLFEALSDIKGIIAPRPKFYHNYHLFTIRVTNEYPLTRDELYLHLKEKGIQTTVKYIPIHRLGYYSRYTNKLPITDKIAKEVLCLPMYAKIPFEHLDYIAEVIRKCGK